ncbi:MAG: NADH-quinone oxidoreductase subunit L [Chloroflexi bacterium]|nr:NADH-quinone oxidoreductase subunit L [Chloroflexota bacterium]
MPSELAWAIWLLPLAAFVVIVFITKPYPRISGYISIAAVLASLVISLWFVAKVYNSSDHHVPVPSYHWLTVGNFSLDIGLTVDSLAAVMLVVVTTVSLLVQVYSQGYMHGDHGYSRFFAYLSLFTASMLGLVLANNLILVYFFWELVGLCSYLLIGFWFDRPVAAAAAKKAFIVTRFGDLGFLIAILALFMSAGSLDISFLNDWVKAGAAGSLLLTWVALGVFAGAVGKSAQFPLHVWLPDAMEGPTPVSALIHAATMVAAGVYLVSRMFFLVDATETGREMVAYIGGFTAIFAASMGLVMFDIKRVLAYSTVSQLGYMMLAVGLGSPVIAMFHLLNHAFFKALMFLGSGSVNHATGTFDMRLMGGLRKAMPITYGTFLVAALAISGIPPFSGFWSKDEILAHAWEENRALFALGLVAAFMTAFYVFRLMFMTFGGSYRGGEQGGHGEHSSHPHESPWVMVLPLAILAVPSVISGFANLPGLNWFGRFMGEDHFASFNWSTATASLIASLAGIFLAYLMYQVKVVPATALPRLLPNIYKAMYNKYGFDTLYENVFVSRVLYRGIFALLGWFDSTIVDGTVNGVAYLPVGVSSVARRIQSGQVQAYGMAIFMGILVILAAFLLRG